jgi:hypothetical protein
MEFGSLREASPLVNSQFDQNGSAPPVIAAPVENPETALPGIMRRHPHTVKAVFREVKELTRSHFNDDAAGCIFAAFYEHRTDPAPPAADVLAMLNAMQRDPLFTDEQRAIALEAAATFPSLDASVPEGVTRQNAKAVALALAQQILAQGQQRRSTSTNNANTTNGTNALTRRAPTGHTAAALLKLELPEAKFAVEGTVPQGVSLIVGPPKIGKSWLTLGLCTAVATGGRALGSIEVEQGSALYLALEDNTRRLKSRLEKVLECEQTLPDGLERLHLFTEWERINEGGLKRLEAWMQEHPSTRLIVIDTLEKIRPRRKNGGSIYGDDYGACEALKGFADANDVAVLIVHHTRKGIGDDAVEAVSGSYGLTGGVDGVLTLKRERGRGDASLFITGRDVNEQDLALKWDAELCLWTILGDASEYRMSNQRANVANALRASEQPLTPKQIGEATGMKSENVRQFLHQMKKAGQVVDANGAYSLSVSPVSPVSGVSGVSPVSDHIPQALPQLPRPRATGYGHD